jgi:hypothetical protein
MGPGEKNKVSNQTEKPPYPEIRPLSFYQIHVRDYLKLCAIWWDILATNLGPETGYSEIS